MSNLDFTNLRRIIINNVEDDRAARDLILKITDMEMVRDMRKEVINSIDDLDVLNEVLQEIQLCELLVSEDEDIGELDHSMARKLMEELDSSGGYEGLFSKVKPLNGFHRIERRYMFM